MQKTKQNRILYLDIMRALAVFMMIQGHTIDTFLADKFRSSDSLFYVIWYNHRGFTAPIFMFTAGVVFTYLLKIGKYGFIENPRIKKGLKRGVTLITIGYLLRYPTARIFDFRYVTPEKWSSFFAVDALHLIGFGLLFIILMVYFTDKFKIQFITLAYSSILIILFVYPLVKQIVFTNYFPEYIAAYFNNKTGSHFPFFPWLIYIFAGSILGFYLSKNEDLYRRKKFSYKLSTLGITLIGMFFIFSYIKDSEFSGNNIWLYSSSMVFLRLGYVLLLNGIVSFVIRKSKSIPKIIIETGRHTLILYVVHLVMLYGSAWSLGLIYFYARSFNTLETIIVAIGMILLMLLVVMMIEKIKSFKVRKLATHKI